MEKQKIKTVAFMLRELGLSYREATNLISEVTRELQSSRSLWKKKNNSTLVKVGLTLIALPDPLIITDVAGAAFVAASMVQTKIKNSGLHVEDLCKAFPKVLRELDALREGMV
jgi:hypothetical protein